MLLPDHLYRRIPHFWLIMGIVFLVLGLMAGSDFQYFGAYMTLGLVSIVRAVWLFQVRQRVTRQREVTVLTATQKIERDLI